ncbi:PrgI family protein [Pseudobutyrivibrio sp. MD2005]|uniref:PrgI family protein n=1 Tax=Pseudobutyrivibrio sp. MD2005 TaxID=1410616 RepID=UPI000489A837|nr:PrgI family protein [Pseudobutyrivibrio sp. MD2005]
MASYIPVPRDLTKVKSKVAFNLTKRQLICFVIAAAIGVPTFFLLKKIGNSTFAAMGMMIVMMPLFFFAMYEKNGQPLEVFLHHFIQATFIRPKIRPYKTDNYYAALMRQEKAEKEVEKIVSESEKKRHRNAARLIEGGSEKSKSRHQRSAEK